MSAATNVLLDSVRPLWRSRGIPDWLVAYAFLAPAAAVFLGLITYPLLDGISTAFTDRAIARPGSYVGLANFAHLLADPIYRRAVFNSLVLTVAVVAAKFVVGLAGAIALHQKFPFRGLCRGLVFLPWAVPGLIAGLSWKWLYDETAGVLGYTALASGLVSRPVYFLSDPQIAMFSIGVAMLWHGLPFFIMMFLAGLSAIPDELYEAAAIDGAGMWRRFWHITLPHLRDIIAITVMLSAIWTFNSFHMVFILTNGGPAMRTQILPTLAYEYGIARSQLGLASSVLVSVLPVFIVLIFFLTRRMLREKAA
jgi:multiple sugar transport system permease protein